MKETIYTIPVTEAFTENANGDCPFCVMYRKLDESFIDFTMGPSYMEDDVRMQTNETGFCPNHMERMYKRPNRLGLALMTHTHLMQINNELSSLLGEGGPKSGGQRFWQKKQNPGADGAAGRLMSLEQSCYICNRIDDTFMRYIDTYFYLWKKNDGIRQLTENGRGFCLRHFRTLLETSRQKLSAGEYENFMRTVVPLELKELKTLEDDLDWFIRKFDYRNADEPWKNSKDALIRGLKAISSVFAEDSGK